MFLMGDFPAGGDEATTDVNAITGTDVRLADANFSS